MSQTELDKQLFNVILNTKNFDTLSRLVKELINQGANINSAQDEILSIGYLLLSKDEYIEDLPKYFKLLLDNGFNINKKFGNKTTSTVLKEFLKNINDDIDIHINYPDDQPYLLNQWQDRDRFIMHYLKLIDTLKVCHKYKKTELNPQEQNKMDRKLFDFFIQYDGSFHLSADTYIKFYLAKGANINSVYNSQTLLEHIITNTIIVDNNDKLKVKELIVLILDNGYNLYDYSIEYLTNFSNDLNVELNSENWNEESEERFEQFYYENINRYELIINDLLPLLNRYKRGKQQVREEPENSDYKYSSSKSVSSSKSKSSSSKSSSSKIVINENKNITLKVINPLTNKYINVGSKLYNNLVIKKIINPIENSLEKAKELNGPKPECIEVEYVINPKTNRKIQKYGKLYTQLVKQGILSDQKLPKIIPRNCINKQTFMLFQNIEDIKEIPDEDFLQLPSGYCFSINEIIDWINSKSFDNKNPHDTKQTLFKKEDLESANLNKSPELVRLLKLYFNEHEKKIISESSILKDHIDILYKIGDTGRICYFDNSASNESQDSSTFFYSIIALNDLSSEINKLPANIKKIFQNLRVSYSSVDTIIKSAENGTDCIHGVGIKLLEIFIVKFVELYKNYNIIYDPLKTHLYFVEDQKGNINMYNTETRLVFNTLNYYYESKFKDMLNKTKDKNMIWKLDDIRKKGLSTIYKEKCKNDPDISTLNTIDEWIELEEWRKFTTEDNYCFDLLFLIRVLTDQLNTVRMTNPEPIYPKNIFTNKKLSYGDLLKLRRQISNNYLLVSPPLLKFLYNPDVLWSETDTDNQEWRTKVINLFEKDMRFRRHFSSYENEELQLICEWVPKDTRRDYNEDGILKFISTADPRYIRGLDRISTENNYYFTNNFSTSNLALKHGYSDISDIPKY